MTVPPANADPEPEAEKPPPAEPPPPRRGWAQKRGDKVVAEIERNRRGDFRVPTWAMVALLVAIIAAWAALIIIP
jgi:hypothetical protein